MKNEKKADLALAYAMKKRNSKGKKMSIGPMEESDHESHYGAIADAILAKKKMAEGGMVEDERDEALIDNEVEHGNEMDDLDFDLLHDDHGIIDERSILKDVKRKRK